MNQSPTRSPHVFLRLWLALACFFRIVFDARFAMEVAALRARDSQPPLPVPRKGPEKPTDALHLLLLLQREGRLLDFSEEELSGFSDAQIGAAARTVHDGCRRALRQAFSFEPVRREAEGAPISVPDGFDPGAIRLTGNVVGRPPFQGVLRHHGWKVIDVRMPKASGDATVIAPAEVELP